MWCTVYTTSFERFMSTQQPFKRFVSAQLYTQQALKDPCTETSFGRVMSTKQALTGSSPHNNLWEVHVVSRRQALEGLCLHKLWKAHVYTINNIGKVHAYTSSFEMFMFTSTQQALKDSRLHNKLWKVCIARLERFMSTEQALERLYLTIRFENVNAHTTSFGRFISAQQALKR